MRSIFSLSIEKRSLFFVVFCFGVFLGTGFSMISAAFASGGTTEDKVYFVPPTKVAEVIEKSAGRRRILFIWKSTESLSKRAVAEYSSLEASKPGSVIFVALDPNPGTVLQFLKSLDGAGIKSLVVKPVQGQNLATILKNYGVNAPEKLPLIVLFNEDGSIQQQGRPYADHAADFIFNGPPRKVRPPG